MLMYAINDLLCPDCLRCRTLVVIKHKTDNQMFYIIPLESILGNNGKWPVGLIRDTLCLKNTVTFSMHQHVQDFAGVAIGTKRGAGAACCSGIS